MAADIMSLPWRPSGLILDPFAGHMRWWKGVPDDIIKRVVFVDRFACMPGFIQADAACLPFRDGTFDQVWADPPHFIRKSPFAPSCKLSYFGAYPTRKALRFSWASAAWELWRVTKPGALMVWKSIANAKAVVQCARLDDLECLSPMWVAQDAIARPSKVGWSSAVTVFTLLERRNADAGD